MDFFGDIFGNERQKSFFEALIREGRLSHAYILEAPSGGGKKTFALRIAAALAAADDASEERDKQCRRILEGLSPDVRILSRGEDGKKNDRSGSRARFHGFRVSCALRAWLPVLYL